MSKVNFDSPFVSYEFDSPDEQLHSQILGDLNKQMIQNLLFQAAMEKIELVRTPETVQREAELQGVMNTLRSLLENSKAAELQVAQKIHEELGTHPTGKVTGLHQVFPSARMNEEDLPSNTSSF